MNEFEIEAELLSEYLKQMGYVKVIRCKDCKHFKNEDEVYIDDYGFASRTCMYMENSDEYDYCSYAKREEE